MTLTFARTKTYSVTIYRALKREHKDSKLSASNVTLPPVAGALWALEMSRQRKPCPSRTTTVCFLTRFGWNAIRSPCPTVPGTGRIIGDSGLADPLYSLSFHICPTDGCLRFGPYEVKYTRLLTLSSTRITTWLLDDERLLTETQRGLALCSDVWLLSFQPG